MLIKVTAVYFTGPFDTPSEQKDAWLEANNVVLIEIWSGNIKPLCKVSFSNAPDMYVLSELDELAHEVHIAKLEK